MAKGFGTVKQEEIKQENHTNSICLLLYTIHDI